MAAAKATMKKILNDDFLKEVEEKSSYLVDKLVQKIGNHPLVNGIRGKGLLIGIECKEQVGMLIDQLREQQLLVLSAGPNVIRLLPPLNVSYEEIDIAVGIIDKLFSTAKETASAQ
jgi:acetylornithine aminotransferase